MWTCECELFTDNDSDYYSITHYMSISTIWPKTPVTKTPKMSYSSALL